MAANSGIKKRITYNKAVGLSDLWRPVSTGEIDYRTKKDPVSFLSYFQRYKKGAKKVQINRGKGLIDSHMQKINSLNSFSFGYIFK